MKHKNPTGEAAKDWRCDNMEDVNSDKKGAGGRGKPKKEVKPFSSEEGKKLINSRAAALKPIVEKLEKENEGTY